MDHDHENKAFSQDEIDNFITFSSVLRRIHNRLVSEGYVVKDGQIVKMEVDGSLTKSC
jgi:hypothetical protein